MNLGIVFPIGQNEQSLRESGQWSLWEWEIREYRQRFNSVYIFQYQFQDIRRFFEAVLLPISRSKAFRSCSILKAIHLSGAIPCLVAKKLYGIPYLLSFSYRYEQFARFDGERLALVGIIFVLASAITNADAVMVPTSALAAHVQRLGARRVEVIPNGVDINRFTPTKIAKRKMQKRKRILYVGRLEPQKNLVELIRGIHLTQQSGKLYDDISLTFVGKGSQKNELKALSKKLNVQLEIIPPIPHNQIQHIYQSHDIFTLPSLMEGHPKSLLEAMSCRLIIIASNIPGPQDIVADGIDGLLVAPDAESIARSIAVLCSRPSFAERLGRAARKKTVLYFDKKKLMAKEIKLLESLAQQ